MKIEDITTETILYQYNFPNDRLDEDIVLDIIKLKESERGGKEVYLENTRTKKYSIVWQDKLNTEYSDTLIGAAKNFARLVQISIDRESYRLIKYKEAIAKAFANANNIEYVDTTEELGKILEKKLGSLD